MCLHVYNCVGDGLWFPGKKGPGMRHQTTFTVNLFIILCRAAMKNVTGSWMVIFMSIISNKKIPWTVQDFYFGNVFDEESES